MEIGCKYKSMVEGSNQKMVIVQNSDEPNKHRPPFDKHI